MFFADDDDIFISPEVFHTFRSIIDLNGFEMRSMPTHTEDGIPIRKLYVSNLPPKTTRTELFGIFAPYGFIKSCWLRMEDRGPNRAPVSTYAFVTFSNPADAHKALIAPIHEKTLRGRRLRISPADSWHQPVEDADGRIRWKPQGQHYDEKRSSPYYGYEQENAENMPESSQSSDNQQVNTDDQSETEQTYNILDILNRDCLNNILMYVPIKDIIRSERVSKGWQSMVQEYLEGVRVFKTSWWQQSAVPLTTAVLRRVLARLGNGLLRLHIDHHWSALNDRTAHTVGKFCPHLDEVKVVGMQTKNWNPLLYGCKHLRNLSFITCNKLTDSSLVHLVKYESSLESLTIANNNQVTGLFLTGSNPSKLSSLSFYNCYSLQGTVLCAAVDTLPNLTTLKLDVCPSTMWKIIPLILNKVPNLQELSLSEYTNIDIAIYPTEDEAFCQAISKLTKLKVLNLSRNIYINNAVLKQVAQNCTLLESLNISSCNSSVKNSIVGVTDEGVAVVCVGCPQLRRLDVSYLAGVGAALAAAPSHLSVLTARACPALTAAPLAQVINNCPLLQEVDVCGCSGVSGVVVGAAVEALAVRPRPLLLRLAGTAAAYAADEQEGEYPTHKLLTVDTEDDLSNPHLRPELADALDDCSDGSYDDLYDHDGLYDHDDDYDDIFGPDEELFLDNDIDDFEHYEYHIQMI